MKTQEVRMFEHVSTIEFHHVDVGYTTLYAKAGAMFADCVKDAVRAAAVVEHNVHLVHNGVTHIVSYTKMCDTVVENLEPWTSVSPS